MAKKVNPNFRLLCEVWNGQRWGFDSAGQETLLSGFMGASLEGSSRSGKTWSIIFFLVYLAARKQFNGTVVILRQSLVSFDGSLFEDFRRILPLFGIYPNPFMVNKKVTDFKIFDMRVRFVGADKADRAHGSGSDILIGNEAMFIPKNVWDQYEQRCRRMVILDYNPSEVVHWVFDSFNNRADIRFLHSTWKDNPFISYAEKKKILGYEPWKRGTYIVENGGIKHLLGDPVLHETNTFEGTANEFNWLVYGLGLRGQLAEYVFAGMIYEIDEIPEHARFAGYGGDASYGGADPFAAVGIWIADGCLYIDQMVYGNMRFISYEEDKEQDFIDCVLESCEYLGAIGDDGNEVHMIFDSANMEYINIMRENGVHAAPAEKGPGSIINGINKIRMFKRVYITKRSNDTLNEFRSFKWDKQGDVVLSKLPSKKQKDHAIAATRYALELINIS